MARVFGADVSGLLVFLVLVNLYFLLVYVLVKRGWLARLHMSLFGPALMIKTERGRSVLDFLARARRTFIGAATVGTWATFLVMGLMTLLLLVQLPFVFRVPLSQAPSPSLILGIPGVNPIIPLGYGLLALIVAVVLHEMSHGVLARAYNLPVKTMGILVLVVPVGAFVEPDEEALRAAPRKQRVRVFGAGPTANLFLAILFGAIFSGALLANAAPVDGAPLLTVDTKGPACAAGLLPTWVVTAAGTDPVRPTPVHAREDLSRVINATSPGSTVYVRVASTAREGRAGETCYNGTNAARGVFVVHTVACKDLYARDACLAAGQAIRHPDPLNRTVVGVTLYNHDEIHTVLAHPLSSPRAFLVYFSLPFLALQGQFPLAGAFQSFYHTPFDPGTFWFLANTCYWLFWINLMLGLTNALPILPLDGGHMFRDVVGGWLERWRPRASPERREATVKRLSLIVTLTLVGLVLLQFVGPYLAALVR